MIHDSAVGTIDEWITANRSDDVVLSQSQWILDGAVGYRRLVSVLGGEATAIQLLVKSGSDVYQVFAYYDESPHSSSLEAVLASFKFKR